MQLSDVTVNGCIFDKVLVFIADTLDMLLKIVDREPCRREKKTCRLI